MNAVPNRAFQRISGTSTRSLRSSILQLANFLIVCAFVILGQNVLATDYFLTIGGGYNPQGNQASLEANVLFFQKVLREKHSGNRDHQIFFADGFDRKPDLQIELPREESHPLVALLNTLHRTGSPNIGYRDHSVPEISGANDPRLIRKAIERIAHQAGSGDRVFIYVTAHGGAAERGQENVEVPENPFNTTISCWNRTSITMTDFRRWLDDVSVEVPVIMVMAQCYCGGFSHALFEDSDSDRLTDRIRVGFFAQQHDLAAAGCRPDIENDAEFSSYFWGAMIEQSRSGTPMTGADLDNDGQVSFAEACAFAVVHSETIDIPLKSSDVLLRKYSHIPNYQPYVEYLRSRGRRSDSKPDSGETDLENAPNGLRTMNESVDSILNLANPESKHIVRELCAKLQLPLDSTITDLMESRQSAMRFPGRFRGRSSSGRRELLAEISERWPELGERESWQESPLVAQGQADDIFREIEVLESYQSYMRRRTERSQATDQAQEVELYNVKLRRLIETLETIVLAGNLPKLAEPSILEQYQRMLAVERQSL